MQIQKTVFISYRHTNSFHALAVYQHLTSLGYDVFYDVDSLRSGDWLQAIIENIKARAHFLIILTPSALERFNEPEDVMRQEIETAIDTQRNIIPLMMENFDFGPAKAHLTGKLAVLPNYNGLEIPARFFKYAMQELHEQRLKQDIKTIIHPISPQTKALVKEQQRGLQVEPTVSEQDLSAEEYFERAFKASEVGHHDKAIIDYTEAIRLNPQLIEAYNNRGNARYNNGDIDGALADYTEAIHLNPQYATAYTNRGITRYTKGDQDGALADYTEAIRLAPQDVKAYTNRGSTLYHKGDLKGAIADYNEALRLNPQLVGVYTNRGLARYYKGDLNGAIVDYNEALRLNPQLDGAYTNRGNARYHTGDLNGAIADYTEALHFDPQAAMNYNNRGEACFALQRFSEALAEFKQSNELSPANNITLAGMAVTHHALGNFQQAKALWGLLLKLDARYRDADWVGKEHHWHPSLTDEARKLIGKL